MGVLTDFFRATPEELRSAFAGWKEPLKTPVRRRGVNPFTKKPIEIESWDPAPEREVHERGPAGPLQMLTSFARETLAEGRRMYMWNCL